MDHFNFEKMIPDNYQFNLFVVLHWFRMFAVWLHKTCILPIEKTLKQYDKVEPTERKWVHHYTMISESDANEFGGVDCYYKSLEIYNFPCTHDFNTFVENEFDDFLKKNVTSEKSFIEKLFIVKIDDFYVVRSFPSTKKILPIGLIDFPKKSTISFSFIEYYHPKMSSALEIVLSEDYYTIGNELLTSAFILRQLDLMNVNYIFDDDYEIRFVDHDINAKCLKFDEYIEIEETTYKKNKNN